MLMMCDELNRVNADVDGEWYVMCVREFLYVN